MFGAQEPQPAQGRPRGRAAHQLRAHAQRGGGAPGVPRRGQGHHAARAHGALVAPADARTRGAAGHRTGHRRQHRLRRGAAPRGAGGRRGARDVGSRDLGVLRRRRESRLPLSVAARSPARRRRVPRRHELLGEEPRRRPRRPARRRGGAAVTLGSGPPGLRRRGHGQVGREDVAHRAARDRRRPPRDHDPHRERAGAPVRPGRGPHGRRDRGAGGGGAAQRPPPPPGGAAEPLAARARQRRARHLRGPGPGRSARRGRAARCRRDAVAGRVPLRVRARPRRARHTGRLGLRIRREGRPCRCGLGGVRGAGGPPRPARGTVRRDAVRPRTPPPREGVHGALGRADPAQRPSALARGRHRHDGPDRGPRTSECSPRRSWTSCARSATR